MALLEKVNWGINWEIIRLIKKYPQLDTLQYSNFQLMDASIFFVPSTHTALPPVVIAP